jgi:NADPH-dependent ferric siderophore reductase
MDDMTDEQLVGYTELHSQTERALFHSGHVNRMLELAGREERIPEGWYAWHYCEAKRTIEAARENLKKKLPQITG